MSNLAEFIYERIKKKEYTGDDILELYVRYIRTKKRDRPIKYRDEDPPKDIKNALIETGKITKEGKWTKEAIDELNELKEEYEINTDVLDVKQLGGRRRKKKSRRRRTKKKKRRRTKKKRRRTKKKRRKRRRRRSRRGGVKIKGNGKKCIDEVGQPGITRGPNSECMGPPGNEHNNCYYSYISNDCKGIPDKYGEDKHCVSGQCVGP